MSRIGVLGEAAAVTQGVTTTVYTVPSGRAAKIKIMHKGIAGANSTFKLTVNGIDIFQTAALTGGNASWSDSTRMHGTGAANTLTGGSDTTTVAPGPKEYQLSALDSVSYLIGTADFASLSVQVIGAEVEVS